MNEIQEVVGLVESSRAEWLRIEKALVECLRAIDYHLSEVILIGSTAAVLQVAYKIPGKSCISFSFDGQEYSIKTVPIDTLNGATDALQEAINKIGDSIQGLKQRTQDSMAKLDGVKEILSIPKKPEALELIEPRGPITQETVIANLGLDRRSSECLRKAKILTVGELTQKTESDLMLIRNFGRGSIGRVKKALAACDLSLKAGPKVTEGDVEGTRIEDLDLSVRPYYLLKKAGILTIEQLVLCTKQDLMNIRGFGHRYFFQTNQLLAARGLVLGKAMADQRKE